MLRTRVLTAIVLIPIVLAVAWLREPWLSLGVLLVVALALGEAVDLLNAAGWGVPRAATYAAGLLVAAWALIGLQYAVFPLSLGASVQVMPPFGLTLAIFVFAVIGLAVAALRNTDPRIGLQAWMGSVFAVAWLGLLGPMLAAVGHLAPPASSLFTYGWEAGTAWLFILFGLVWSCDTGAYFVGRAIGRRKLHPTVSPGKTVEGFVGGIVVAALVTAALGLVLVSLPVLIGLLTGAVTAAIAQAGDLAKSLLKRAADRKDSGNLFPGHGGMLDRVDSLLFAAPTLIVFAVVLGGMGIAP
ncbi:MAG TPA: phosphatidate cytidylyltransferase [Candidatus Binatia bacterium]|nr:phosphatidate cytidylyltransferase [Candidatus Binatia bacterium]